MMRGKEKEKRRREWEERKGEETEVMRKGYKRKQEWRRRSEGRGERLLKAQLVWLKLDMKLSNYIFVYAVYCSRSG